MRRAARRVARFIRMAPNRDDTVGRKLAVWGGIVLSMAGRDGGTPAERRFFMYDGFTRRLTGLSRRLLKRGRAPDSALLAASAMVAPPLATPFAEAAAGGVRDIADFGDNPGGLRMRVFVPGRPPRAGAPLLVLLHGCGQDAANFADAAGFFALAERLRAPLLLPEQVGANNPGRCFNWFRPRDYLAGAGEAESIRQMVATTLGQFQADPKRVFVAGLSAGGAMAAALLAAYPDVFAGGGVVAGLPVGAANDVSSALASMSRAAPHTAIARADGQTVWPSLSVWQGASDRTVDPANADALVAQWSEVLDLGAPDADEQPIRGVRRRAWGSALEYWTLAEFGHGFPALSRVPADPFVLPAPVQAADAMARFWGLDPG
jgi:poly(hydroxyalkanoate) depolymerase family esterase